MEYIEKVTKGYKKNYKTANGKTKETKPSLSIYLGAKTGFSADETVVICNKGYFYNLLNNSNPPEDIELKLDSLNNELETLKESNLEYSRTIYNLNLELSRIKEKLENKDQQLTIANNDLRNKSNKIESLYGAIVYYKEVIAKYRELNIIKRIFKYDVEKDLEKTLNRNGSTLITIDDIS